MSVLWLLILAAPMGVAADNPHGRADACTTCHAPPAEGAEIGQPLPIVETCRSCHPTANMHPVDVTPDAVKVAEGWPLENGKVVCSTCHAEPAHEGFANVPTPYHRGGPYKIVKNFCYQCHERAGLAQTDPHHPTEPNVATDPTCGACHAKAPEPGAAPEASHLLRDAEKLCVTCHLGSVHTGAEEHLYKVVPPEVIATLPKGFALTDKGEIACWTCHDVHKSGGHTHLKSGRFAEGFRERVLAGEWADAPDNARWPGSERPEHPPMLTLPLNKGALCVACHGELP